MRKVDSPASGVWRIWLTFLLGYANVEEYLRVTEPKGKSSKLQGVLDMAKDQLEVIASHQDVKAMNKAMLAFSSLQHVQLLRLQTELHFEFLHHLRRHPQAAERFVHFGWEWASLHVSRTVGCAFLRANSPATRLSSQFDVPSIITLMARHKCSTEELASRLECLSIRFESFEKEWYTSQLSKVFRHIFIASQHSMVSMHLGFPQEPVSISLEEVFLGVRMERLRVFSIDNWRLDGEMIIKVVRQYSNNLRGMRLRGVLLEPGSFWKDVLQDIRLNMSNLVWLSLRRVNYVKHFNEKNMGGSVDYSDDGAQSGSDIEDRWSDEEDSSGHLSDSESDYGTGSESEQDDPDGYEEDDDDSFEGNDNSSVADSNTGSDHEAIPNGHRVHFAIREGSIHGDREVFCTCKHPENFDSLESLRDDGEKVSKTQWKMWELWTLGGRGCAVHDGHDTSLPHTENI